jgi:hypothetical protein
MRHGAGLPITGTVTPETVDAIKAELTPPYELDGECRHANIGRASVTAGLLVAGSKVVQASRARRRTPTAVPSGDGS